MNIELQQMWKVSHSLGAQGMSAERLCMQIEWFAYSLSFSEERYELPYPVYDAEL
jgi:hypothetical protein